VRGDAAETGRIVPGSPGGQERRALDAPIPADAPRRRRRFGRPRIGRPAIVSLGWTVRDFAKRVWDNSGEDNVFFLAGGIAFNIMLAAVPFFLLLASGLGFLFGRDTEQSSAQINEIVDQFFPANPGLGSAAVHTILHDVIAARGAVGIYGAVGFVWFSTRLFGSLRSVLAEVFDIDQDRGIIAGKIFDIQITVVSSLLLVIYTAVTAYVEFATTRGVAVLSQLGLRDDVMGGVEYLLGRSIAFVTIAAMFFALYKFLPNRRIRWQTALTAAVFSAAAIELAKLLFGALASAFNPGSLYTGTLAALIIAVVWVYYVAMIFILGGEVAQVADLRRTRRRQRIALEA
jgi:membrane protein